MVNFGNEINQDIKINNIPIDRVHSTKFLGVYIDSKLNWSEHIKCIRGKLSKSIGIICKARTLLNRSTLVTLYNSFVSPYISYCIEVWGNTFYKYLLPLYRLQKRVIRLITIYKLYCSHFRFIQRYENYETFEIISSEGAYSYV